MIKASPEVPKPSQEPCIAFYPQRRIRNLLSEKHFQRVGLQMRCALAYTVGLPSAGIFLPNTSRAALLI